MYIKMHMPIRYINIYMCVFMYVCTRNYIYCVELRASSSFWMVRILTKHRVQIKVEGNHKYNRMTGILNRGDCN